MDCVVVLTTKLSPSGTPSLLKRCARTSWSLSHATRKSPRGAAATSGYWGRVSVGGLTWKSAPAAAKVVTGVVAVAVGVCVEVGELLKVGVTVGVRVAVGVSVAVKGGVSEGDGVEESVGV